MIKKITFLLILLTVSLGFSQTVLEDFEGPAPTITYSNGMAGSISTTQAVDVNSWELISSSAGQPWQQGELLLQGDWIDLTTTKTATVEVYSDTAFNMLMKVVMPENAGPESATSAAHTGSGWETLNFDFNNSYDGTGVANDSYGKMFFFYNWNDTNNGWNDPAADGTFYVDDITAMSTPAPETCSDGIQNQGETGVDCGGPCTACPSPPTTAAPTPPARPAADVISLYSDAYADVGSIFDAGWCGPNSVEEVMIAGNPTMHFLNNACQGIVLDAGVDATSFTNLHVDIFIQAGTDLTSSVFNLKFVQQPGAAALEINLNIASSPALVAGSWLSVDVPVDLAIFTGFKEFGITSPNLTSIVWYDNLYVHKDTTLSTDDFEAAKFKVFPNPAQNVWNVNANTEISKIQVYDVLGKSVMVLNPMSNEAQIDASSLPKGLYFANLESAKGTQSIKLIKN